MSRKTCSPMLVSCPPGSNQRYERRKQPENAASSIDRTVLGITTLEIPHFAKQARPIYSNCEFGSNSTSHSCLHPWNARLPNAKTLLGTISFSMLLSLNQSSPTVSRPCGSLSIFGSIWPIPSCYAVFLICGGSSRLGTFVFQKQNQPIS